MHRALYEVLFYALAAFVPMFVYAFAVWNLDRYEKEPLWLLLVSFAWGAIPAAGLSLFAEGLTAPIFTYPAPGLSMALIGAPLWEELAKGLALVALLLLFRHELDSLIDGVVYGSLIGFGFSATEDTLYLLRVAEEGSLAQLTLVWIVRSYLTGLGHAMFTSLFGVGIALARLGALSRTRRWAPLAGLAAAVLMHALFNLGTLSGFFPFVAGAGTIALYWIFASTLRIERGWIRDELAGEVDEGLVTRRELRVLLSPRARAARLARAWMDHGWGGTRDLYRFYKTASDLAFQRRHLRSLGPDEALSDRVRTLRARLAGLGERLAENRLR